MTDKTELLTEGRDLYDKYVSSWSDNRIQWIAAMRFYNGEQWPEALRRWRETDLNGARPCLVNNRLPQHIKQVTNEQRQNRPSIHVLPADDGADKDTAEVLSGLIRQIEYVSDADVVYSTAGKTQTVMGIGYWRVMTQVIDPTVNKQEIRLKRISNPLSVVFDPWALDPAGADANDVFVVDVISRARFKEQYPGKVATESWDTATFDSFSDWYPDDESVRVCEWFHVKQDDGKRKVCWYKMTGSQVLKEHELDGEYIPVVRVIGEEIDIDGKRMYHGLVRNAIDPQRMYNYWVSKATELAALQPNAPYIGAAGAFDTFEDAWAEANNSTKPYLEYNTIDAEGKPIPPPQRSSPPTMPNSYLAMVQQAGEDIKGTMGQYGQAVGQPGDEKSGRAIIALQKESDNSTFDYIDNLAHSIRHTGRIIVDLIPFVYDTPRIVRVLGEDHEPSMVKLDPGVQQPITDLQESAGIQGVYNPGVGQYDVRIVVGPSYASKRQEAADSMDRILSSAPQLWDVAGDLLVKNLDWPGADKLAERLERRVPPELKDEAEQPQSNPQDQMMIQQLDQTVQAMQAEMEQMEQKVASKDADMQRAANDDKKLDIERQRLEIELKQVKIQEYQAETARMAMIQKDPRIMQLLALMEGGLVPDEQVEDTIDGMTAPEPVEQPQPTVM